MIVRRAVESVQLFPVAIKNALVLGPCVSHVIGDGKIGAGRVLLCPRHEAPFSIMAIQPPADRLHLSSVTGSAKDGLVRREALGSYYHSDQTGPVSNREDRERESAIGSGGWIRGMNVSRKGHSRIRADFRGTHGDDFGGWFWVSAVRAAKQSGKSTLVSLGP